MDYFTSYSLELGYSIFIHAAMFPELAYYSINTCFGYLLCWLLLCQADTS